MFLMLFGVFVKMFVFHYLVFVHTHMPKRAQCVVYVVEVSEPPHLVYYYF